MASTSAPPPASTVALDAGRLNPRTPEQPASGDVALLIDWENLKWGLREFFRAAPNITSVIAATREHGRLVTARAYADWTQPSLAIDAPNLYRAGIEPVYAQGRHQVDGTPMKNSADVRLAVDTVALCNQLPHVRTYVLVTGDGDLVHPLNYIRLNGHRVVVIAVGATISTLLQSAADKVLVYERDVEPLEAQRIVPVEHARPIEEAITRLRQVLPPLLAAQRAKQSFTAINESLLTRYGFNARDYGMTFKELMLLAAQRDIVEIATEGSMDFALPPGQAGQAMAALEEEEETANADTPAPAYQGDVRIEHLEPEDQGRLIEYIADLEETSRFLTVTFLVDRLTHTSVVPMLSEAQVKGLVLKAIESNILLVEDVPAISKQTKQPFRRRQLYLNNEHAMVATILDS
ncbi:MAG TPA: NYN domain-containing protein [Gemmatimonadaceae bacterium]